MEWEIGDKIKSIKTSQIGQIIKIQNKHAHVCFGEQSIDITTDGRLFDTDANISFINLTKLSILDSAEIRMW